MEKVTSMYHPMYAKKKAASQLTKKERKIVFCIASVILLAALFIIITPAYASNYTTQIQNVMSNMIGIVGTIFQAVGVILTVYAVGQLVLAFKNEDANSKSSASTLLVVGIVLIALPSIVDALGLVSMIGG